MFAIRRVRFMLLVASAVLLAVGIGPQFRQPALASLAPPSGVTTPYAGRLDKASGESVSDGMYDFVFSIYGSQEGGEPLWSEKQLGVPVKAGAFATSLGSVVPLPKDMLTMESRWLAVAVRGPGEASFTPLAPRQRLDALATSSPTAPAAGLACPHDHLGEEWKTSSNRGLWVEITSLGTDTRALVGVARNGHAVTGYAEGDSGAAIGVWGDASSGTGVRGDSVSGTAVEGFSDRGNAALFRSWGTASTVRIDQIGDGPLISGYGPYDQWRFDVMNDGRGRFTGLISHAGTRPAGWFRTQSDGEATMTIDQLGESRVLALFNNFNWFNGYGGGDFIVGSSNDDHVMFRVTNVGQFRTEGGVTTSAQDFAEMLPAVEGLEPGDVLVIGPDGTLIRSSEPNQTSVAGVYSTKPGIVGGQPMEGDATSAIPLTVVGVVPVKVTAENGAISPGDLLVTSSMPGHAMKAGPNPALGTVIGKALGQLETGTSVIKMLATLQ